MTISEANRGFLEEMLELFATADRAVTESKQRIGWTDAHDEKIARLYGKLLSEGVTDRVEVGRRIRAFYAEQFPTV